MKKYLQFFVLFIIVTIYLSNQNVYAQNISSDFEFMIETIGIPKYNVHGNCISEKIYNIYNIFVYGEPELLFNNQSQRYKIVENGKYIYNSNNVEFNLLGYNYNGGIVHNFYFPVDFAPESTPNNWNFIYSPLAYNSWNDYYNIDKNGYEYMINTPMLFGQIDFVNNKTNPYNQIDYGITANKIGLDKAVLNTPSSFKTSGIITASRIAPNGSIRYAIYTTKPMASNCNVVSNLKVNDSYNMNSKEESIIIPINFGANITGLNEFATKNNIKELVSILYIDNVEISKISISREDYINKTYDFQVKREDLSETSNTPLDIKVESYFYTEFEVDGIFKDETNKTIYLTSEKQEIIRSSSLYILEKQEDYILTSLIKSKNKDNNINSLGVVEKSRYLALTFTTNKKIDCENTQIIINNKIAKHDILINNNEITVFKIEVNDLFENSLASWKYLRDKTLNYFDINFDDIGSRVSSPNEIVVLLNNQKYEFFIDVIDELNYNFNYYLDGFYRTNEVIHIAT